MKRVGLVGGIDVVVPTADQQQRVHDVVYQELTRNVVTAEARHDYLDVIDASVPLIDTTDVHCRALLEFILEGAA